MATRSIKSFYMMTKPGIVYGNVIHVIAGLLLAAAVPKVVIHIEPVLGVIVGTALVIASACVANNYIDRHIDARMKRTKSRVLARGVVSREVAIGYSAILGITGLVILAMMTNWRVVALAALAYVSYVFLYTFSKRVTVHSTLIGSVPGALPAMAGYVALTGRLDIIAWLLFGLIVCWQMPHFYAISLFRKDDYAAAGLPVMAIKYPLRVVKINIVLYMILYILVAVALGLYGGLKLVPAGLLVAGGLVWLGYAIVGFRTDQTTRWARKVFSVSLILSLWLVFVGALNLVLG